MSHLLNVRDGQRPRLLVTMMSAMNLRDLTDCGALSALAERFEVDFVWLDQSMAERLSPYGNARYRHANPRPRYWLWNCASTIGSLQKYRKLVPQMDRQFFNRKTAGKAYWHWSAALGQLLYWIGLGAAAMAFIKWALDRSVGFALELDRSVEYAAVLVPTVLRDLVAEDMVRWARRKRIPAIAIQGNWDCFNLKQMLVAPDHFLIWGEQSFYFARLLQDMPHESLHVIGSQRHDHYFGALPGKEPARRLLGLDSDRPILLFCGIIGAFDEKAALHELDAAISDGRLPERLQLLYKPHPLSKPEQGAHEFGDQGYKHVRLVAFPGNGVWNPLDEYQTLFRAVDATLSPYSTMGLESALCGRPTLCLGFHTDPRLPYWRYALQFLHIQSYRFLPWALRCDTRDELIAAVSRLLALARDAEMERVAIDSTSHIIYRDELPYAERLCKAIEHIISDRDALRSERPVLAAY